MSEQVMATAPQPLRHVRPPQQELDEMRRRKMSMTAAEWKVNVSKLSPDAAAQLNAFTFRTPTKTQLERKNKPKKKKASKKKTYTKRGGRARGAVRRYVKRTYRKRQYRRNYYY